MGKVVVCVMVIGVVVVVVVVTVVPIVLDLIAGLTGKEKSRLVRVRVRILDLLLMVLVVAIEAYHYRRSILAIHSPLHSAELSSLLLTDRPPRPPSTLRSSSPAPHPSRSFYFPSDP